MLEWNCNKRNEKSNWKSTHPFPLCMHFTIAKFEVACPSRCRNINRGTPKLWGAILSQGHTRFFFWWDLRMGHGKPQQHATFVFDGFIYYGNIREFVFKRQFRYLSHPLGELGVTYGPRLYTAGKCMVEFLLAMIEIFWYLLRLRRYKQILVEVGIFQRGVGRFDCKC